MKRVLLLIFIFFISDNILADTHLGFFSARRGRDSLVGTIEGTARNTIEIRDERDKRVKQLVYVFDDIGKFHRGDRVRVYYRLLDNYIESIKRMTPVEYKKQGQNLGYIFKKDQAKK